jgi:hypothetical protein
MWSDPKEDFFYKLLVGIHCIVTGEGRLYNRAGCEKDTMIAIVDDDAIVRDATADLIRSMGYTARTSNRRSSFWILDTPKTRHAWSQTCNCLVLTGSSCSGNCEPPDIGCQ